MGADLELRHRIDDFDFDLGAPPGYFVEKLARENGWGRALAERVLGEYRRYLYLACVADHVVVPSDQVDMAWHQHLLDTELYWGTFCTSVLRLPLQHRPSKGTSQSMEHHRALYQLTLSTYAEVYGEQAPSDVWPAPEHRFDPHVRHRRIALADNWIVPRREKWTLIGAVVAVIGVLTAEAWIRSVFCSVADYGWNILCWDDPAAFGLVIVLLTSATIASFRLWRRPLDGGHPSDASTTVDLDPFDAAVLQCDTRRAVNAAVAALVYDGAIGLDQPCATSKRSHHRLIQTGRLDDTAHPLERAVFEAVGQAGCQVSNVHARTVLQARTLRTSLRARGLLRSRWHIGPGLLVMLPLLLVSGATFAALWYGRCDWAGGATGICWTVTSMFAVALFFSASLSPRGAAALREARSRREPQVTADLVDVSDGRELAWVIALQGPAKLENGPVPGLYSALTATASEGGGGDGVETAGCGGNRDLNSTCGCGCG